MKNADPLLLSLTAMVQTRPDFVVLHNKARKITAGELLDKSGRIAAGLCSRGFKKNDIAVIAVEPGAEFLEIMYAVIALEGKIAIIDPEMGRENYAAKMNQLQPRWMFLDSRLLFLQEHPLLKKWLKKTGNKIPELFILPNVHLISVGKQLPVFRDHMHYRNLYKAPGFPLHTSGGGGETENVIIYTSGTLSIPKGVLHTGNSLGASIDALKNLLGPNRNAIVGAALPHFILLGIAAGLTVKMKRKNPSAASGIRWLQQENIGVLFGPPSDYLPLIRYVEKNNRKLPASLEHVLIGSAPVHNRFLERLIAVLPQHTRITCMYGMTENLLVATIDGREKTGYRGPGDLVGKPVFGVSIKIEEDGEIMIRSNQQFSRYYHEEKGREWHATGDLGELDHRGNLVLHGRKKEMIIRRNMNIYPALYENTIKHIKGVEEAALVGIYDDESADEKVYLALEGKGLDIAHIQNQLFQGKYSIDREALPDHIFNMVIPRKGRQNKIDRHSIVEHIRKNIL